MPVAPSPIPNITTPVPLTSDPDTFDPRADQAWSELPVSIAAINAETQKVYDNAVEAAASAGAALTHKNAAAVSATAALAATGYMRRSSDSLSVGAGAKSLTGLNVPSAAAFANDDEITLISASDGEVRQWGVASLVDAGAGTMTVTVAADDFAGTGPADDWIVIHRAFEGMLSATAAEVRAAVTAFKAVSPASLAEASEWGTLTDAPTIAWAPVTQGFNAKLTLTANAHTMGAPTGLLDGWIYVLNINPATYTLAGWNAIWDFGAVGPPSLPASAWSKISAQYNAARNKLEVAGVWRGA